MIQASLSISPEDESATTSPGLTSTWQGTRQQGLKRLRTTVPAFAVGVAAMYGGALVGAVPLWTAHILTLWCTSGLLLFYALLSSGITTTWRDPSLLFGQFFFGCLSVVASYTLIEAARSLALLWLCVLLLFEIHRLSGRQLNIACMSSLLLMWLASCFHSRIHGTPIDLVSEWISLATGAVVLPVIRMVSLRSFQLRTQMLQQKEELALAVNRLAMASAHDPLTGLPNRSRMQLLLNDEIRRLRRTEQAFCLAIIDLDHFKCINDTHGHATGDAVLCTFGEVAHTVLPPIATLARWGGEEFLLLMPETSLPTAIRYLDDLRAAVHAHDWSQLAPDLKLTFSAGLCEPAGRMPLHRDLERADRALYQAKARGRDCILLAERT